MQEVIETEGWWRDGGNCREERKRGFSITHMLRSIIPSFVRRTMRARGTGLKKDRHTVTASNPGETPANPEVSGKNLDFTQKLFLLYYQEDAAVFMGLKGNSTTKKLLFWTTKTEGMKFGALHL